jgi:hypothetical protein
MAEGRKFCRSGGHALGDSARIIADATLVSCARLDQIGGGQDRIQKVIDLVRDPTAKSAIAASRSSPQG